MVRRKVRTAAASVAVIAGALTLFAACDWGVKAADTGQSASAERCAGGEDWRHNYIRINPKDPNLSDFVVQDSTSMYVNTNYDDHNDTYWHFSMYSHNDAKKYWGIIQNYGLKALGSKASIVYWEDKRSGLHYDHYHWYLVVNDTKIAEYEKVGGAASAAYDHVRLLKSWWDLTRVDWHKA